MQRIAAVWHASPQKLVGVLFALLLAAAMAVGSGANFTSQSVNAGNLVAAGTLKASGPSSAVLNVTRLRPTESQSGEATISNTGNTQGAFSVTASSLHDTPGSSGGPNLSDQVTVAVQQLTAAGGSTTGPVLYNGKLSNLSAAALGNIAGGGSKTYKFTVSFPSTGTDAGDNAYQGAQSQLDLTWDAVQS